MRLLIILILRIMVILLKTHENTHDKEMVLEWPYICVQNKVRLLSRSGDTGPIHPQVGVQCAILVP